MKIVIKKSRKKKSNDVIINDDKDFDYRRVVIVGLLLFFVVSVLLFNSFLYSENETKKELDSFSVVFVGNTSFIDCVDRFNGSTVNGTHCLVPKNE